MNVVNFNNISVISNNASDKELNLLEKYKDSFNKTTDIDTNIFNNVLLKSKNCNNNFTDYNIEHMLLNFRNVSNLIPNIDTFNNWLTNNSNKEVSNSLIIENGVFFNALTCCHGDFTHLFFDFTQHINIFYDLLIKNEDYVIIIEFIPWIMENYKNNFDRIYNINIDTNIFINFIRDTNIFINFIRDIGLKNKIEIISPVSKIQSFKEDSIFIKNMHIISFVEFGNIKWIPLISRVLKKNGNFISDTLINIINKEYNGTNPHFTHHKQKFFLLEKRTNSSFDSTRNIDINIFNDIEKICQNYCNNNNLKLVIWDNDLITKNSIYQQYKIANNSEIIIGFGGSFFLFNYTITNGKVLILNVKPEYNNDYNPNIVNMNIICLLTYYQIIINNNVLLHYKDNTETYTTINIINFFLNSFK